MEERTGLSRHGSQETGHRERHRWQRKAALLVIFGVIVAGAAAGGVVSCGEDEDTAARPAVTVEVTPTVQPSPTAEGEAPETAATAEETAPAEPTVGPSPEGEDEYAGWLTYTNDVYGYEFRYPPGAEITEATQGHFSLPTEEFEAGVTFEEVYDRYTGKVCVTVRYELGYINISAPPNESFRYVICGRTSRAYEGPDREETLLIDGGTYTAGGFEEQGPGETLNYHNEMLVVYLEDGTMIGYGAGSSDTATFEDYLLIRDVLLTIVQSYRRLP